MQVLQIGQGRFMNVIVSFRDGGKDAEWAMVGGQRIKISDSIRAYPEIFKTPEGWVYKDGSPITNLDDVEYLPEPYRSEAQQFINKGKLVEAKTYPDKNEAVEASQKRSPGRPKSKDNTVKRTIEIKDEASLHEASGGTIS